MSDCKRDMIGKLWSLGNTVTGFTVLQSIAIVFFCLEKFDDILKWYDLIPALITIMATGPFLYIVIVRYLNKKEQELRRSLKESVEVLEISKRMYYGRLATIVGFNFLAIVVPMIALIIYKPTG